MPATAIRAKNTCCRCTFASEWQKSGPSWSLMISSLANAQWHSCGEIMKVDALPTIHYPAMGVCGLSCRLCPRYQSTSASRCEGCKTASRLGAACSLQTCAFKKQKVEYCGQCSLSKSCRKWADHRKAGREHDSFISYQQLEGNISLIEEVGLAQWNRKQIRMEKLLKRLLAEYDDGRSRSFFCLSAALLEDRELKAALAQERRTRQAHSEPKARTQAMHATLDRVAAERSIILALRK